MSTILRKRPTKGWTGIPNASLRDRAISYRATGVLAVLLSMDDGWAFDARVLAERKGHEGRTALLTALRELRVAGYMRHTRHRVDQGRFVTEVEVSDVPVDEWKGGKVVALTGVRLPDSGSPATGSPDPGPRGPGQPGSGDLTPKEKDPLEDPRETALAQFLRRPDDHLDELLDADTALRARHDASDVDDAIASLTAANARFAWPSEYVRAIEHHIAERPIVHRYAAMPRYT